MGPFQFRIADILLLIVLASGIAGAVTMRIPAIGLITAATMLVLIWHRPVLLRLWAVGLFGIGAALLASGLQSQFYTFDMAHGEQIAWGAGLVFGSAAAFIVFGTPLRPR